MKKEDAVAKLVSVMELGVKQTQTGLREEVHWFAQLMEWKLLQRDAELGPRGWIHSNTNFGFLFKRMQEEMEEAREAIVTFLLEEDMSQEKAEQVLYELADIANFAMMAADRIRQKQKR